MQKLRYSVYAKPLIMFVDLAFMLIIFSYFYLNYHTFDTGELHWRSFALIALLFCVFWILLSGRTKIYSIPRNLTFTQYLERLVLHVIGFTLGVMLLVKISKIDFLENSRFQSGLAFGAGIVFLKSFLFFFLKYIRSKGLNVRNVMLLGKTSATALLKQTLQDRTDYGFKIFDYPYNDNELNILQLEEFWKNNGIYSLFMPADNTYDAAKTKEIMEAAERHKIRVSLVPGILNDNYYKYELNYINTQPVLFPYVFPLDYDANYLLKRLVDVVISLFFLITIASWLFPIIAVIIKLETKGPVFFLQERYGYRDKIFTCIKFRTMTVNSYSNIKVTAPHDDRITRVGRVLRRFNIDETPQFINVLLGQMSVVGPRPHMLIVDDYYKPKLKKYAVRSMIKPGITGLAQVNGLRGDDGNKEMEMQKRVLADAFYVKNWSLSMDIIIIIKTVILCVTGHNKTVH